MRWLREFFIGNWRNKGVALVFAVTIWFVTYQAEKKSFRPEFRVLVVPDDPDKTAITAIKRIGLAHEDRDVVEFEGKIRVVLTGPRSRIEELRDSFNVQPPQIRVQVPPDTEIYKFSAKDFDFSLAGIEIDQISPESIRIYQEPWHTRTIRNLADYVVVTERKENYEVAVKSVDLSEVKLRAPASIVDSLSVRLPVSMGYIRESYKGWAQIDLEYPEQHADLVRLVDLTPSRAQVEVRLKAKEAVIEVDAVRLTFRIPPPRVPVKIVAEDVIGGRIPLEFYGPEDKIARLQEKLASDPTFSVGVLVPPRFDREKESTFTFTEEALELYGFPDIKTRQHRKRREEKKGPWTCRVIPAVERTGG